MYEIHICVLTKFAKKKQKYVTIEKFSEVIVAMQSKREQSILQEIKEWERQLIEQEATDFQKMFDKWMYEIVEKLPKKACKPFCKSRWLAISSSCIYSKLTIAIRCAQSYFRYG